MPDRDFYQILGLSRNAGADEVRKAYRRLARKYHPDLNPGDKSAEARFKEMSAAYEVLSDPQKRRLYDEYGEAGLRGGFAGAGPEGVTYQRGPGGYTWRYSTVGESPFEDFDFSQFRGTGGAESAEDLFSRLFGAAGGGQRVRPRREPQLGADVESELRLTFDQAARGATTDLKLRHPDGRVETLTVKIPPGVCDGRRVRLKGQGRLAPDGGPRGDLYIVCRVAEHPYFRLEGRDVYVELPISAGEAVLGAEVDVPTLGGMTTVKIPPGTSSGQKLRLRGKGVPGEKGEPPGDQYVVVRVVVPKKVDGEAARLMREFQERTGFNPRADVRW